jgi:hypothetical protein
LEIVGIVSVFKPAQLNTGLNTELNLSVDHTRTDNKQQDSRRHSSGARTPIEVALLDGWIHKPIIVYG